MYRDTEKFQTAYVPAFTSLVNFPSNMMQAKQRYFCSIALKDLHAKIRNRFDFTEQFRQACVSESFRIFAEKWGLEAPVFTANALAKAGEKVYDRFYAACKKLPAVGSLAVVFHGTAEENIEKILNEGLNPLLRRGQAYGPGEYFSTEPGLSISYCKGGSKMLVFLVVIVPPIVPPIEAPIEDYRSFTTNCPSNIVVVSNNDLQIPLGFVSFRKVSHIAHHRSESSRERIRYLSKMLEKASQETAVAKLRAKIIQHLIKLRVDIASEVYNKNKSIFCDRSKREISMYAHRLFEKDFISFYFEDLPPPMTYAEHNSSRLKSVDRLEKDEDSVKQALKLELQRQPQTPK